MKQTKTTKGASAMSKTKSLVSRLVNSEGGGGVKAHYQSKALPTSFFVGIKKPQWANSFVEIKETTTGTPMNNQIIAPTCKANILKSKSYDTLINNQFCYPSLTACSFQQRQGKWY
jgi:hypothetical protein